MSDILEISAPSHRNQLCTGIGRLLESEVGCDFEFSWADSSSIKAHFIVLQIFCCELQNSTCRQIRFESAEIQREDVRSLLEFIYRGKTRIEVKRLDAIKRAAGELGLESFLDLVDGMHIKSVKEEVENERDTENEEEVCESLAENDGEEEEDDTDCAADKGELKRRKRSIDSNASNHVCETCAKCFQSAASLRMHKKMHLEKVDCEECGKKFSLNSIWRHQKMHKVNLKKFKCTICDVRSRDRFNLKVHLKNVHHMPEGKIARLVHSEATRVSDEDRPQSMEDLGKARRSFNGRKKRAPKRKSQPKH